MQKQVCSLHQYISLVLGLTWGFCSCSLAANDSRVEVCETAQKILNESGIQGGLIVHIGCGDGKLTAQLCANDRYLVHGLTWKKQNIDRTRNYINSLGLYGSVSVEHLGNDCLPYTDNLVNLVVSEDLGGISMDEVMRVLCPNGVAYIKDNRKWKKTVKPWPGEIDEWSHYLHGANNNAVAKDTVVGPPKHMQWVAKPLHCRSHEVDSSVCAMVSAGGRVFYILDEGFTGVHDDRFPSKWSLIARDAFNGVLLWKKPIPRWGWRQWKRKELEGKDRTGIRGERLRLPVALARRLVAEADRVYITLGYDAPVTSLDAATGEVLKTYGETDNTEEILLTDDILLFLINQGGPIRANSGSAKKRDDEPVAPITIRAVRANTGEVLWNKHNEAIVAMSVASDARRVFFHDTDAIVCLDLRTGNQLWRTPNKSAKPGMWNVPHTLVASDGVVLFEGPKKLLALSAETGQMLWTGPGGRGPGVVNPPDLFVINGLVWYGGHKGKDYKSNIITKVERTGYDVKTGQAKKKIEVEHLISTMHHFRCYRSKATENYLLWTKRGVEFIDLKSDSHMRHDWLRAPCRLGFTPCNGFLYIPPHPCFCYTGAKLNGFMALTGQAQTTITERKDESPRLEHGSAYGQVSLSSTSVSVKDWPTYRHDHLRSGSTACFVPVNLKPLWRKEIGGRISQPVVVGGMIFITSVDEHTVHCLSGQDGTSLWSFIAGGRVDSPPTLYRGLVLFGCADGWMYCLRASDGELVWRFRGAPQDRRIIAFGQLESAWPIHGSVLVQNDVVYFGAGRSSYLDGGIYLYGLEPHTGKMLYSTCVHSPDPDVNKDIGRPYDMEGTKTDVLVSDGSYLYMQQTMFDGTLQEQQAPRITDLGDRKMGRHVFSTAGFLNDSHWDRTFWMYSERWPGFYLANQVPKAGQLLVFDDATTYAVKFFIRRNRHSPMFFPAKEGYLLFADDNNNEPLLKDENTNVMPLRWLPPMNPVNKRKLPDAAANQDKGVGFTRIHPPRWREWVPIRIEAMVLADATLFVAGPPDEVDAKDPLGAFEGRKGANLWAVSTTDGTQLAEYSLDSPPVFDGMIAANERLYISTRDGALVCMGAK